MHLIRCSIPASLNSSNGLLKRKESKHKATHFEVTEIKLYLSDEAGAEDDSMSRTQQPSMGTPHQHQINSKCLILFKLFVFFFQLQISTFLLIARLFTFLMQYLLLQIA